MVFQSTPSGGKATCSLCAASSRLLFQSTPSGGKATSHANNARRSSRSFNPRLPGGRRRHPHSARPARSAVSIHAFRGEGDSGMQRRRRRAREVSIHAFRGEGDSAALRVSALIDVSIHAFRGEGDMTEEFQQ